ncbi:beta-galactosidase [Flammeovirga sp. SubArs3]|uniref:beta-galactosidase n=1 Tax=Flammeovirga sp. SubArs3 TaxID=2995316 RepID=UPI00248B5991|nr:beta-galactosidase [Flammeovirga sp. SubArs3]
MKRQTIYFLFLLIMSTSSFAQNLVNEIQQEKRTLLALIKKAEKKGIDVTKEKSTIRTAEICERFANWDEKNIKKNEQLFKRLKTYKQNPLKVAEELPNFEREEIVLMLQDAQQTLELALKGKVVKQPIEKIDWSKVKLEGSDALYNGKPVFLADYTWKPKVDFLTEYHGNLDGIFVTTKYLLDEQGTLKPNFKKEIIEKPSGRVGTVFLNHLNPPKWFTEKYPEASVGSRRYFDYDIDHPATRALQQSLLKSIVPTFKDKKYSSLGYMLVNEPHWHTKEKSWDTGEVSSYTFAKFRKYLEEKHKSITQLNVIWNTSFESFDSVKIQVPMSGDLRGSAVWYDWMRFNQLRGTEWFQFLSDEIHKYDPKANTHIKVMPHLFSENARDHGIDLEALTEVTTVIGNDAGAVYSDMWGKKEPEWSSKYYFDWKQLCIGYDFMKSVSPDKLVFNSEGHFISTIRFRDLKMKPEYARATYWLATMLGLDVMQTWFWPRDVDGSLRKESKGYAASLTQMPRVINEITLTYLDMNANAEALTKIQKLRKPVRIFHSETSAINKPTHMEDVYHTYEQFLFEGIAVGFATKNILNKQPHHLWDVVVIENTPFVTKEERNALQEYLDQGGTIVMDNKSILKNEYGESIDVLTQSKGQLIKFNTAENIQKKVLSIVKKDDLQIHETNMLSHKGCIWRYFENEEKHKIVSIVNVGKSEAKLDVLLNGIDQSVEITDVITGNKIENGFTLKPLDVYLLKVGTIQKKGL